MIEINTFYKHPLKLHDAVFLALLGLRIGDREGQSEHKYNQGELQFFKRQPAARVNSLDEALDYIFKYNGSINRVDSRYKYRYLEREYFVLRRSDTSRKHIEDIIALLEKHLKILNDIKKELPDE